MSTMQERVERDGQVALEARRLLRAARVATLGVVEGGAPSLALVTPAVALDGAVLLLLSRLAAHTRALDADPRAGLLVAGAPAEINPQTSPRLSLSCEATRTDDRALRARYLAIHPYARLYADFTDFGLFRLEVKAARYVGGFARAARIAPADLRPSPAALDGLTEAAAQAAAEAADPALADRIAARHGADGEGGSNGWRIAALDSDGVDLGCGERVIRIPFAEPVAGRGIDAALATLAGG